MADSVARPTESWNANYCRKYLPQPKPTDHKYKRGTLCCITGSKRYPGAALLTTSAALATGIGMVRFQGANKLQSEVILNRPEIVVSKGRCDTLLMGSGIPANANFFKKYVMSRAIKRIKPKVLDAGALYLAVSSGPLTVITPHYGELAKLLKVPIGEIENSPIYYAKYAAEKFNLTVLLKGHRTVIANSERIIYMPGAPSRLATAGTGDVLAGVLGALIAINIESVTDKNLIEIAATASLINALAAEEISGPLSPTLLISEIPKVIAKLSS